MLLFILLFIATATLSIFSGGCWNRSKYFTDPSVLVMIQLSQTDRPLADLLSKILSFPGKDDCLKFLSATQGKEKLTEKQRRTLSVLAGVEENWINCDQKIKGNVSDLAVSICSELYEPHQFYTCTLVHDAAADPRNQRATVPLMWLKRKQFWSAWNQTKQYSWLPPRISTYEAVVHFIQEGSGTGVHVGNGIILTCAHVVDSRDDCDEDTTPNRIGRMKTIIFPNGQVFLAQCKAVTETADGISDTAALQITTAVLTDKSDASPSPCGHVALPCATMSSEPAQSGDDLVCIGNPSSIDLEAVSSTKKIRNIEFSPRTWHTSVGRVESRHEGQLMTHSCWTYWGHSGAPLFNREGRIVGLHCAWDDTSGVRQAQGLDTLIATLAKIERVKGKESHETAQGSVELVHTSAMTKPNEAVGSSGKRKREVERVIDLT